MPSLRPTPAAIVLLASVVGVACGSSITRSESVTTGLSLLDPAQPRAAEPTVHVTSAGVTPVVLHVDSPVVVTFVNEDSVTHRIEEAPELQYTPCPELAQLEEIRPGQRTTATIQRGNLLCAYHEASAPGNRAFQGLLAVH